MAKSKGGVNVQFKRVNPTWAKALSKHVKGLCGNEVAVGFPLGSKAASVTYPNGASVLQVAMWNEFGTRKIPARDFMGQAAEVIKKDLNGTMASLVKKAQQGKVSAREVYAKCALFGETAIKDTITNGNFAPNAPFTVEMKESDRPLIDTGQMRASVASVVRKAT